MHCLFVQREVCRAPQCSRGVDFVLQHLPQTATAALGSQLVQALIKGLRPDQASSDVSELVRGQRSSEVLELGDDLRWKPGRAAQLWQRDQAAQVDLVPDCLAGAP
jgi:hypothetical protein